MSVALFGTGPETPVLEEIRVTHALTDRGAADITPWIILGIVVAAAVAFGSIIVLVARRPKDLGRGSTPGQTQFGQDGTRSCPSCGAVVPVGNQFCGRCGQRMSGPS